jgi:hypothetical protein
MKQLDFKDKIELAEEIASLWTERADLKEIMSYYYNAQYEYLNDLPDDELLALAEDEGLNNEKY